MERYKVVSINTVGITDEDICTKVNRGVFNRYSVLDYLGQPLDYSIIEATINLSRVGWISMFDWWLFTCLLHKELRRNLSLKIRLDFLGKLDSGLLSYRESKNYIDGKTTIQHHSEKDYYNSYAVHRVINFVKALEPRGYDNIAGGRLVLGGLSAREARSLGWYRRNNDIEESVILPRTTIGTDESRRVFLGRGQIEKWRESMSIDRVPEAAIFHSDEFWRVLCYELASNICEHAEDIGFVAGRVVIPNQNGYLPLWCGKVYRPEILEKLNISINDGFVELCVSDSGKGIPATIMSAYQKRYRERHHIEIEPMKVSTANLIKFAFDELGTSKNEDSSWITERHALGHALFVVAKYGGILVVRSGDTEVIYIADKGTFSRCDSQLGFEPQIETPLPLNVPGTHLQLLIPLTPAVVSDSARYSSHLPSSFHIDPLHPVGPLIPVQDRLDTLSIAKPNYKPHDFKVACRELSKEILEGPYTRSELIVLDFGGVNWTPAKFETFLYLMQNVLHSRPVLFTQVSHKFAEAVINQEEEDAPSYLPESFQDEIRQQAKEREFTEGKFLETYSGLGEVVLALGPDSGEYLFGVRDSILRAVLHNLLGDEGKTINELSSSSGLARHHLEEVLNQASNLFKMVEGQRWKSVFTKKQLDVQRLRSITEHFKNVAHNCRAWRGKVRDRVNNSEIASSKRYYLPSENVVYNEFLETSRIVARERYVIEIAERLIYRLLYGLERLGCAPTCVEILACSTTPTVLIGEAIRRVWPVQKDSERPVVVDYGPSLFTGADSAYIRISDEEKPRAVVIQDIFSEGTLAKKTVFLAERQGANVLFVLSFIRFLESNDCPDGEPITFTPASGWEKKHDIVGKPIHAMIGVRKPVNKIMTEIPDWGENEAFEDYVVDPRSLRPVTLRSLRLESDFSTERALTLRDACLRELDMDGSECRLAAGHFVYGHRHFAVVVNIRGVLNGDIGRKIINQLADICCDVSNFSEVPKDEIRDNKFSGNVSAILLPLYSQIHYILSGLQLELAQRGHRVPPFLLDSTSFGGGVHTYEIPYQIRDQIWKAASEIKLITDSGFPLDIKEKGIKQLQLRLLFIDDAIFSGRTLHTVLESLAKHVDNTKSKVYGPKMDDYAEPIEWIQAFVVINELPQARSALWHQLDKCPASRAFRFKEYAPFIGVATYTAADCPFCKEIDQLNNLKLRIASIDATEACGWIEQRKKDIRPHTTEAHSFGEEPPIKLPEPIDVLPIKGSSAYVPFHADSAIWRFRELMYLSYPLGDILKCLDRTRRSGARFPYAKKEYARFRSAVYDWCYENWHQVHLYHAEDTILFELNEEVDKGESIIVETIYKLSGLISVTDEEEDYKGKDEGLLPPTRDDHIVSFVKRLIDTLAERDISHTKEASQSTLDLDIALTLLFFSASPGMIEKAGLLDYLHEVEKRVSRRSSFVGILYRRFTKPKATDPFWALTTIAETCYRGGLLDTPEQRRNSDHELLGHMVCDMVKEPENEEYRRRLEGTLHIFMASVENLEPYFGETLLDSVMDSSKKVRDWLKQPLDISLSEYSCLEKLLNSIEDESSWDRFTEKCHMSVERFVDELKTRFRKLQEKWSIEKDLSVSTDICDSVKNNDKQVSPLQLTTSISQDIEGACIMTHIEKLYGFISNYALEPAKTTPTSISGFPRLEIMPSCKPHFLTIKIFTCYGLASEARKKVEQKSGKIQRNLNELRRFGVEEEEHEIVCNGESEPLLLSLTVPVGFEKRSKQLCH
jgi:hypothetical protein